MIDVIIVSKTRMSQSVCVGGVLTNGRFVRLLNANGSNHNSNTQFKIGDIYTITFSERDDKRPPHVEDILLNTMKYKGTLPSIEKMVEYLMDKKVQFGEGSIENLFEGKLQWTSGGSGYISKSGGIPNSSVEFWLLDKDLMRENSGGKIRYNYALPHLHLAVQSKTLLDEMSLPFVGFQNPVDRIPAGTLVRVSLARWWCPESSNEERCYLQLSGWYGLSQ